MRGGRWITFISDLERGKLTAKIEKPIRLIHIWVWICWLKKMNLNSLNKNYIIIVTEPTTPLIFHAQPGGTFLLMGYFMCQYPKQILTIAQQVQSYIDAEMEIASWAEVEKALRFPRLKLL